jgi:AAA15 family ATPase/GTPase
MRFRSRNFRSLKEEQELSLVASSLKDSPEAVTHVEGLDLGLVRVAAIYGANASGKSNVIKALAYMSSAVQNSQRQWAPEGPIPREPFLLDPQAKLDPSSFEVDLLLDGVRFHYGFTLNDREILKEWLDAYPTGSKPVRKQMWFKREARTFTFGKKLVGDNSAIERLTRPNSLFLSAAAQNNHETLLPVYKWFAERFGYVHRERGPAIYNTAVMCMDAGFKSWVSQALRSADMGIVELLVREENLPVASPAPGLSKKQKVLAEEFSRAMRRFAEKVKQQLSDELSLPEKMLTVSLIHKGSSRVAVPFGLENESDGTVAFYGLLGPLVHFVSSGGTLCVDELDASLHPLLALGILNYFRNPKLNPRGAQIIFTTHDTNILDRASLRRDQIWFTEKDAEGGTHLYPLTDFKPRKNENLERGYLQGRYGAVPFIGSPDFLGNPSQNKAEH